MDRQYHNSEESSRGPETNHHRHQHGSDSTDNEPRNDATESSTANEAAQTPGPVRAAAPFVWQFERRLLLLDEEPPQWVLAELEFDVDACRYVEVRRASYHWPREAVGALLSRSLASGNDAAASAAEAMDDWFTKHYGYEIAPRATSSVDHERPERPL